MILVRLALTVAHQSLIECANARLNLLLVLHHGPSLDGIEAYSD